MELRDEVVARWWIVFSPQAANQNVAVWVVVRLGFGQFTPIDQRLHVRMVERAVYQSAIVEVVNARIASVGPVAVTAWVDEKRRHRAVRLLLGGNRCQADDDVRFFHQVLEHGGGIVGIG